MTSICSCSGAEYELSDSVRENVDAQYSFYSRAAWKRSPGLPPPSRGYGIPEGVKGGELLYLASLFI